MLQRTRIGLLGLCALAATAPSFAQTAHSTGEASSSCACPTAPDAPTPKPIAKSSSRTPKAQSDCGGSCNDKIQVDVGLLQADALRKALRWSDAAKSYLEVVRHAGDEKTKQAARDGYSATAAHALLRSPEDEARFLAGQTEERAGHWSAAADKYLIALRGASDADRAREAREAYERAAAVSASRAWRWSRYFPPIWWYHGHPWLFYGLLTAVCLLAVSPRLLRGRGALARTGRVLEFGLRPAFSRRVRIVATTKLTDDAPAQLFAAQLPQSAQEVARRWNRVGVSFLSGPTTLLSLPTSLANQIANGIPEIKGINLSQFALAAILLGQYFTWRVESQIGFAPDASGAGSGRMRAYATLRWAWTVRGSYAAAPTAADKNDVDKAAYAIAARVLGAAQPKRV